MTKRYICVPKGTTVTAVIRTSGSNFGQPHPPLIHSTTPKLYLAGFYCYRLQPSTRTRRGFGIPVAQRSASVTTTITSFAIQLSAQFEHVSIRHNDLAAKGYGLLKQPEGLRLFNACSSGSTSSRSYSPWLSPRRLPQVHRHKLAAFPTPVPHRGRSRSLHG